MGGGIAQQHQADALAARHQRDERERGAALARLDLAEAGRNARVDVDVGDDDGLARVEHIVEAIAIIGYRLRAERRARFGRPVAANGAAARRSASSVS
jgi:hypothetical protein